MLKNKITLIFLVFSILPAVCWAGGIDNLKTDFLQGNYRRVIFEGQAQVSNVNPKDADELNYILGLSYLKEEKLESARDCFKRSLNGSSGKFKQLAQMGMADTYLLGGQFQEAEGIYNKLINDEANSSQKAAILYRLSQLEFKRGNNQRGNDYLSKLKRDFPLSPELRLNRELVLIDKPQTPIHETIKTTIKDTGEYSVQVGFFSNSVNANNLRDKLVAAGFPAYIQNSGSAYRVKVGRLRTLKEAQDLESSLSKSGYQTKIYP